VTVSDTSLRSGPKTVPTGEADTASRQSAVGRAAADERALLFATRTTGAALLAFTLAQGLDIAHPWWAAMTVWLVAQPTRGLLIERCMARLAGTVVGALAGGILLSFAPSIPIALAALLLWIGLCAGLGSMFRHSRNYGLVLAGYTAAIVVLFALGDVGLSPHLPFDRVWCTVIGVGCSALASIRIAPGHRLTDLNSRLNELLKLCLDRVEAHLRHHEGPPDNGNILATRIAALDRMVDEAAAGALRERRAALHVRRLSGLLLELVALTQQASDVNAPDDLLIEHSVTRDRLFGLIDLAYRSRQVALGDVLDELALALDTRGGSVLVDAMREADKASAMRAVGKPVIALSLAAAIWLTSGWQYGFIMAMTATLFASLFSSHDQGNQLLAQVLYGSLAGAVAGIATRWFLLPHAGGIVGILCCIAPTLLAGAWLMRRASTAKMAIDLNMTFLLTSQPEAAPANIFTILDQTSAILAGVLIAAVTFWLIVPASPHARRRQLAQRIMRLAGGNSEKRDIQAAMDQHRALRATLVRLLDISDPTRPLFAAASDCLVRSRLALADRVSTSPFLGSTSFHFLPDDSAQRRAVAALGAILQEDDR